MKLFLRNFIFLIVLAIILIFARFFIQGSGQHMVFVVVINIWFSIWLLISYSLCSYYFKNALIKSFAIIQKEEGIYSVASILAADSKMVNLNALGIQRNQIREPPYMHRFFAAQL